MNKHRGLVLICLIVTLCSNIVYSNSKLEQESIEWNQVKASNGITVYSKKTEAGYRFKGVGRVTVHDIYTSYALAADYENLDTWLAFLNTVTVLKQVDANTQYIHATIDLPIIKDRDLVFKFNIYQEANSRSINLVLDNKHDYIPDHPNYIRVVVASGLMKFEIISDTEIEVTYELEADTSGLFARKIANYFLKYAPYQTIINMREAVKNPQYHNQQHHISLVKF